MSDELSELIDAALKALPADLLSHVCAKGEEPPGVGIFTAPPPQWNTRADAEVLWKWIRVHLRLVLECLGKDARTAARWAASLPKPWLYESPVKADLSRISPKARRELKRWYAARRQQSEAQFAAQRRPLAETLASLAKERDECKRLRRQMKCPKPKRLGKPCRATEEEYRYARAPLREYDQYVKKIRNGWDRTWGWGLAPQTTIIIANEWPDEVQAACDEAEVKQERARAEWGSAFWGCPAVWLWVIWRYWSDVTRLAALPPAPDWPDVDQLAQGPLRWNLFLTTLHLGIAPRINAEPGEAANGFKGALEELREKLTAPESSKPRIPKRYRLAHESHEWACTERPKLSEKDRYSDALYKHVKENWPGYGDPGPACPPIGTWARYVREYERLTTGPKNTSLRDRGGRSIVHQDEL